MKNTKLKKDKVRQHLVLRADQKQQIDEIAKSHDRGISSVIRDLIDCSLPAAAKTANEIWRQRFQQDEMAIQMARARTDGNPV